MGCLGVVLEEGENLTLQEVLDQTEGVVFDPETQMVVSVDIGEHDLDAKVAPGTYYIVPKVMELAPVAETKDETTDTTGSEPTAPDPPPAVEEAAPVVAEATAQTEPETAAVGADAGEKPAET
ncbi:MAG: hypothetical protein V1685_02215 [Parcubacteria group bacterium]